MTKSGPSPFECFSFLFQDSSLEGVVWSVLLLIESGSSNRIWYHAVSCESCTCTECHSFPCSAQDSSLLLAIIFCLCSIFRKMVMAWKYVCVACKWPVRLSEEITGPGVVHGETDAPFPPRL